MFCYLKSNSEWDQGGSSSSPNYLVSDLLCSISRRRLADGNGRDTATSKSPGQEKGEPR